MDTSPARPQIRRLTPADAGVFQALRLSALLESPTAFGSSHEEEVRFTADVIEGRLALRPDRGVFGAFADGQLIGMVALGRENHRKLAHKAMIWGLYVAPDQRRSGAGRALLQAALALATSVGEIRQVNLSVNAGNTSAIRLYEAHGFQAYGHEAEAMLVDGVLHDEVHMRVVLQRD